MEQIHKWVTDPEHKKLLREGDGIGTSATRAGILADLRSRQFLASRGKHVISTALGRALVDAVPEAVKSAALTALYERMLKDIELGEFELQVFIDRQAAFVTERVAQASGNGQGVPFATANRGEVLGAMGRTAEGVAALEEARTMASGWNLTPVVAQLDQLLATLRAER